MLDSIDTEVKEQMELVETNSKNQFAELSKKLDELEDLLDEKKYSKLQLELDKLS